MKLTIKETINKVLREKTILLGFILSTIFFLYQHTTGLSWDFSSYILNAKYLFGTSLEYFEWYRGPLMPFLLGILSLKGMFWTASEYLYIILVSAIFAISSVKLANKFKINKNLFYILELTPFVLNGGLLQGTELFSLALLQLALVYLYKNKSGFFFGLAWLLRYTNLIFLPLLIFNKKIKKILLSLAIFTITISPWLIHNYLTKGMPLVSFIDSYLMNVALRRDTTMPFSFIDLIAISNFYLPLFFLGMIKKAKSKFTKHDYIMIFFLIISLISYFNMPTKVARYLLPLLIPIAYYSSIFLENKKFNTNKIIKIILIVNFVLAMLFFHPLTDVSVEKQIVQDLGNCSCSSNEWVLLRYLGAGCNPMPRDFKLNTTIEKGHKIYIFKDQEEPKYAFNKTFMSQFDKYKKEETKDYILIDKGKCIIPDKYVFTYLELRWYDNLVTRTEANYYFYVLPYKISLKYL